MDTNLAIVDVFVGMGCDAQMARNGYEALRGVYPQINNKTKLTYAQSAYDFTVEYREWVTQTVHAPVAARGTRARLWRIVGELFNKPQWIARGNTLWSTTGQTSRGTIKFQRMVIRLDPMALRPEYKSLVYAYDVFHDTIYIRLPNSAIEAAKRDGDFCAVQL